MRAQRRLARYLATREAEAMTARADDARRPHITVY